MGGDEEEVVDEGVDHLQVTTSQGRNIRQQARDIIKTLQKSALYFMPPRICCTKFFLAADGGLASIPREDTDLVTWYKKQANDESWYG